VEFAFRLILGVAWKAITWPWYRLWGAVHWILDGARKRA
jgi:hypothetical protein